MTLNKQCSSRLTAQRRVGPGRVAVIAQGALCAVLATVALGLGVVWCEAVYAQDEGGPHAAITLEAPAQVEAGAVISVTLRLSTPLTVGGWEAELRFDPAGAEFAGFYPAAPAGESSVGRLLLPQLPTGSAVGVYTCATAPCLERREVQAAGVETEPGVLGVVELLALTPGAVEVALSHVQVVDAAGTPLPVRLTADRVTVQVGSGSDRVVAPASAWPARTSVAVAADVADVAAADVTAGGGVTHADVMEVALAWGDGREQGDPCGWDGQAVDINGDGCVDIADVQIAAALAGPADLPAAPQPPAPSEQDDSAPRLYVPFITGQGALDAAALPPAAGSIAALGADVTITFTVNSALDTADAQVGNGVCLTASGVCTLRAAIAEANAQPGANAILFNIPGSGVHTIQLGSRLPTINDEAGGVLIDGYSQPGATANTDPSISNAQLRIEVRGNGSEQFDALAIISAGNTIRGLAIYNCKRAFWVYGVDAHDNAIVGNFIGTDAAGDFRFTVTSEVQAHGVHVEQGAYGNRIGGVLPAERNVVSGNARHGVGFWHVGTSQNLVYNNLVGLSPNGQRGMPNNGNGVDLNFGAARNLVGGIEAGERNVISGNRENGAEISHAGVTTQNRVVGNYIGTDVGGIAGPVYAANGENGVWVKDRVRNNLVADNVIGNNRLGGVNIDEFGNCCANGNVVEGNRIGVGVNGSLIPNEEYGVRLLAANSRIGPGNIIAYNPVGILVEGDDITGNTITQNSIYGNVALGIDIAPLGQVNANDPNDPDDGPNLKLNFPEFATVSQNQATGTACEGCRVEVFVADGQWFHHGQGKTFAGAALAGTDGTFSVTLDNVAFGQYLTATATDPAGNTSEFAQNTLVRDPANAPPRAADDTAATPADTPIVIDVLVNDVDLDGDPLTVVDVAAPNNGVATTNGTFVIYRPNGGFVGVDSLQYTASDNFSGISTATVTVTVEGTSGTGELGEVIVNPTELTVVRDGGPESYSVTLGSEPAAAVTITLVIEGFLQVEPREIVFDAENWDKAQTVTVSMGEADAADANTVAAIRQNTIHHLSRSADESYDRLGLPSVTVYVTDPVRGVLLPLLIR